MSYSKASLAPDCSFKIETAANCMSKSNSKKKIINYLESLTKEQLIDLILKFAPQSFLNSINVQFALQDEAVLILEETSKAITTILSDEELLYNPSEFERELFKQLEKIRGLWDKFPSQIGDLIVRIIEEVEQAFEDGYLYIQNYGQEDDYFESEDVNDYIVCFVSNLPKNLQPNYLQKLRIALDNCGYSTFLSVERKLF